MGPSAARARRQGDRWGSGSFGAGAESQGRGSAWEPPGGGGGAGRAEPFVPKSLARVADQIDSVLGGEAAWRRIGGGGGSGGGAAE